MMQMKKKIIAVFSILLLLFVLIVGIQIQKRHSQNEIKTFTAFFSVLGEPRDEENEIKKLIAQKTGASCEEIWLTGQTADTAIASYIASGEYPDFISGDAELLKAGALIPIDEYWDDYPNIKNYMSEKEWELLRQEDGHIYWIPQFGVVKGESSDVIHEGEAFWIQTRVLKWAGYPQIHTVREYFELLEDYYNANPVAENGQPNIPFTILCDDWRFFCLENPPQFLDGYPNDGCCIVDPVRKKVIDYNMSLTAKRYFRLLNQEYQKGMIDPESFVQTYEEYLEKLSTGCVLGMVDQWWQFAYNINDSLESVDIEGRNYVPLPITIDKGIKNKWHVKRGSEINTSGGISITISCEDIPGAMQFINDLMDEEIMKLRFWGVENVDYHVDEHGRFYRTKNQRTKAGDAIQKSSHFCSYAYFPRWEGKLSDKINAFAPEYQPNDFYATCPEDVKECLAAYGCSTYVDMIGTNDEPGVWYPMYSYTDTLTADTTEGEVRDRLDQVKHNYLPQVIMSQDFDSTWESYTEQYHACNPDILYGALQKELIRRLGQSEQAE